MTSNSNNSHSFALKPVIASVSLPVNEKSMVMPQVSLAGIEEALAQLESYGSKPDLVLLPMYTIVRDDPEAAEKKALLQRYARERGCYVVYNGYEQGYSVSRILDRQGKEAGSYCKTHKIEEIDAQELKLGDAFPVFQLDFAKVALLAGTDLYIPEVAEMYSISGAEILLCSMGIEPLRDDTIVQHLLHARAVSDYMFVAASSYASDHPMYMCNNYESAHHPLDESYDGIGTSQEDFNSNGLGRLTGRSVIYDLRGEIIASSGREGGAAVAAINIAQKKEVGKYIYGLGGIIYHQNQRGVFNGLCDDYTYQPREYPVKNPVITMLHVPYGDTIGGWYPGQDQFNYEKVYGLMEKAAAYSDLVVTSELSAPTHDYTQEMAAQYSKIARENHCYILVNHELVTDFRRNTSFLYDREGKEILRYEKINGLHFVYQNIDKVGFDLPVAELDFARVGVMVCMDVYSQEIPRLLALKGADIIFLQSQSWGYDTVAVNEGQARAYAIENGVVMSTTSFPNSQVAHRSNVIDPTGETVFATRYDSEGLYSYTIDVDKTIDHPCFGYRGENRVEMRNDFRQRLYRARRPELYAPLTTVKRSK